MRCGSTIAILTLNPLAKNNYSTYFFLLILRRGIIFLSHPITKIIIMRDLLYLVAVLLIIGWVLGFFVYSVGWLIHILLVLAVIAILLRIIGGGGDPV